MDMRIDAEQIEHVLSHLARLRQQRDQGHIDMLEGLRPSWLSVGAWDVVLEDLAGLSGEVHDCCDPSVRTSNWKIFLRARSTA